MSIENFNEQMQSANRETPLFEALRKLQKMDVDATAPLTAALRWPAW